MEKACLYMLCNSIPCEGAFRNVRDDKWLGWAYFCRRQSFRVVLLLKMTHGSMKLPHRGSSRKVCKRKIFLEVKRSEQGEFRQRSAPFAQEALEYNMRCRNFPRDPALTSGRSCGRIGVQRAGAERDGRRKAGRN